MEGGREVGRLGECKVVTVQLHNHQHVACEWNSLPLDKDRKNVSRNSFLR